MRYDSIAISYMLNTITGVKKGLANTGYAHFIVNVVGGVDANDRGS